MADYKASKHRIFNDKMFTLTAGTRQGRPTKKGALEVVKMNKKYGYKFHRIVKVGMDYYLLRWLKMWIQVAFHG